MSALRVALGTRPERRRYLALGWVLGVGGFALGTALLDSFVDVTGPWAGVGAVALFVLAAVAAYDGAGLPVTVGFVALVTGGLAPFVTVGVAGEVPPTGSLAVRAAFVAAVGVVTGIAVGVPGFLAGAAGRWWRDSRSRPVAPDGSDDADDSDEPNGSRG